MCKKAPKNLALHITQKIKPSFTAPFGMQVGQFSARLWNDKGGIVLQRTCYILSPFGNLLLKTAIGADRTGKPPLRCSVLLHSSLTPLPGQWNHCQSCKYTLGATFIIISKKNLIARHKSFGMFYGMRLPHVWHFTHGQAWNVRVAFLQFTSLAR